jgi:CubicO group peptidase (beta-lactamase class C family)
MRRPIGSVGKTITAAEVVSLAEDGLINLDDPATRYLPKGVKFDTNGASVRDLLRMQSGIPDPPDVFAAIELGPIGFLTKVPHKRFYRAGTDCGGRDLCNDSNYSSTNYLLLGMIIEEVTGRPIAESLASDVLSHPGLEGVIYRADDATGAMGLMSSDSASLARWGFPLYGGHILSAASLAEVSDYWNNYGLGAMEITSDPSDPGIGHLGNDRHDSAGLVAFPRTGIAIAVLTPTGNCCTTISNMIDDLRAVIASHPASD